MSQFRSGFSKLITQFIEYRKISGSWNESCYGLNIKLFDHFCADNYGMHSALTQEMVDTWCSKRNTETNTSNKARTNVIRVFIDYLRKRNLTNVTSPTICKSEIQTYTPHIFKIEELRKFFHECDNIQPHLGKKPSIIRKLIIPVFFRLLYSTGIRTTEARLLKVENIDFNHGVINIQKSKGYDQHYVVMHDTMTNIMFKYNNVISEIQPYREYFFQSCRNTHYSRYWVQDSFSKLWKKANNSLTSPVAYDLRHNYAIVNINSWIDEGFGFSDKLQYLSKSMGHRSIEATRYYYSIVPRLADIMTDKTECGFNTMIPEVNNS